MKKIYFSLVAIFAMAFTSVNAQFYDGFTGTGNIGGDCSDATCNNNGWYTHSNTKPATINIIDGSLNYTGLQASTGNKVFLTGVTLDVARDVNAALTGLTNVAYMSVLINVVDNTNLSTTGFDYFMHFAQTSGNTAGTFFGRLGIKSVGGGYRLGIANNAGNGGAYTEHATDLVFGTTYLVVMKYDIASNTASLWVNPSSLGGVEPAGATTNNSSTTTVTGFGAICIRNGYNSTITGGTPKVEIDEIRVAATFADVTPAGTGIFSSASKSNAYVFPNPVKNVLTVKNAQNVNRVEISNIIGEKLISETLNANNSVDVSSLFNGIYFVTLFNDNQAVKTVKFIKE